MVGRPRGGAAGGRVKRVRWSWGVVLGVGLSAVAFVAVRDARSETRLAAAPAPASDEPVQPLPAPREPDRAKVALGKRLFHDPKLSANGAVTCATCHPVDAGGMNANMRYSVGAGGPDRRPGTNTPTVFNAFYSFEQSWAGGPSLEDVLDRPVTGAKLMGPQTWADVVARLDADHETREAFDALYGGVSEGAIKNALAAYMEHLVPRGSRFDQAAQGVRDLEPDAQQGYRRFKALGCVSCHQGVNVGGNMFARLGVFGDYFADRGGPITDADKGRWTETKRGADMHVFRVPSLRNVALTPPYFHDGSAATLPDAIRTMAKYQLGRELSEEDVRLLVAFLTSLTGEVPADAK